MFSQSARFYDEIYAAIGKNYAGEVAQLDRLIRRHKSSPGRALLDVACGTGAHAGPLAGRWDVTGLDLDPHMLAQARRKYPSIRFRRGDMLDFSLNRQFDAIVCLFSSIGYARTIPRLDRAIATMSRHLRPGGVLVVEPWFSIRQWRPGRTGMVVVDKPGHKIVRLSRAAIRGRISILDLEYLIATPRGIEHASERHTLGLFFKQDYLRAFRRAGLVVSFDARGLTGRGLYVGVKPA